MGNSPGDGAARRSLAGRNRIAGLSVAPTFGNMSSAYKNVKNATGPVPAITMAVLLSVLSAATATAKIGETVPQLLKRFGRTYTIENTASGQLYKFRSQSLSVDVSVIKTRSVAETYYSDHPLDSKDEPPSDIVRAILRTNNPTARWTEIESAPLKADHALRSSDSKLIALLHYKSVQTDGDTNFPWTITVYDPAAVLDIDSTSSVNQTSASARGDIPIPTNFVEPADPETAIEQGTKYAQGQGVAKDLVMATAFYLWALDHGATFAARLLCRNIAAPYAFGDGVQKSPAHAKWIFERCRAVLEKPAHNGDPESCLTLGLFYGFGIGTERNCSRAVNLFLTFVTAADRFPAESRPNELRSAAAQDLAHWSVELMSTASASDRKLSMKALNAAAALNSDVAEGELGLIYSTGQGVTRDPVKAAEFLTRSAEHGNWQSQHNLAMMYRDGVGVLRDYVESLKWYNVAAIHGDKTTLYQRDLLERMMGPTQVAKAQEMARAFLAKAKAAPEVDSRPVGDLPTQSGTGFFVTNNGYLLTNYHVVSGARKILIQIGDRSVPAKTVVTDASNDLALLKADGPTASLPLGDSRHVSLGESVMTIGYPNIDIQGTAAKLTKGEISSLTGVQDDPRMFQISVPIQPGNSGGPLIDEKGNVVGITSGQLNALGMLKAEGSLPQNVNYALKISYAELLLDGVPEAKNKLSPRVTASMSSTDVIENGRKATALVLVWKQK